MIRRAADAAMTGAFCALLVAVVVTVYTFDQVHERLAQDRSPPPAEPRKQPLPD